MPIYRVGNANQCTLITAPSLDAAIDQIRQELGTVNGPYYGKLADAEDIDWIRSMGGRVPDDSERIR